MSHFPKRYPPVLAVPLMFLLVAPGCRKADQPSQIDVDGTVEKVAARADGTGEITARYYSEGQGAEVEAVGKVTAETKITINGQPAGLADIKEGDRIKAQVLVNGKGTSKTLIALTIQIERGGGQ